MGMRCSHVANGPDGIVETRSSWASFTTGSSGSGDNRPTKLTRMQKLEKLVQENKVRCTILFFFEMGVLTILLCFYHLQIAFYQAGARDADREHQYKQAADVTEKLTLAVRNYTKPANEKVKVSMVMPLAYYEPELTDTRVEVQANETESVSDDQLQAEVSFNNTPSEKVSGTIASLLRGSGQSSGSLVMGSGLSLRSSSGASERSFNHLAGALEALEPVVGSYVRDGLLRPISNTLRVLARGAGVLKQAADAVVYEMARAIGFCQPFMTREQCNTVVIDPMVDTIIEGFKRRTQVLTFLFTIGVDAEAVIGLGGDVGIYVTVYPGTWKFKLGVCAHASTSVGTSISVGIGASVSLTTLFDEFEGMKKPGVWKLPVYLGFEAVFSLHGSAHILLKNVEELDIFKGLMSSDRTLTRWERFKRNMGKLKTMIKRCTVGLNESEHVVDPDIHVNINESCFLGVGISIRAGLGVAADGKFIDVRLSKEVWAKSVSKQLLGSNDNMLEEAVDRLAPGVLATASDDARDESTSLDDLSVLDSDGEWDPLIARENRAPFFRRGSMSPPPASPSLIARTRSSPAIIKKPPSSTP